MSSLDGMESVGFRVHARAVASRWVVTLGLEFTFFSALYKEKDRMGGS